MMSLGLMMIQEDKVMDTTVYGNFKCPKCGERHSSDTAMLLCGTEYQKAITEAITGVKEND
jgi:tRNA(Ile2) C34 agmatinyltransferase TiaS